MQLFDYVPLNFFNIFSGESKRQYSDALFIIYKLMTGTAFMVSRDKIMDELSDYFETIQEDTFDSFEAKSSKDKASACLRRLKECGWIKEEMGKNYETHILFEDYATAILETLVNLDRNETIEYGGYVYTIHTLSLALDQENSDEAIKAIEQMYENTLKLMNSLKTLNANIKKYIERLIQKKEEDDIQTILDTLLIDYQERIVNKAYQNLKTIDNPNRYKNRIINRIDRTLHNIEAMTLYSQTYAKRKDISILDAENQLHYILNEVIDAFELLDDIMAEIDHKHTRYLRTAVARITYLYQNRHDLEGKIHSMIHTLSNQGDAFFMENEPFFNLEALRNLDKASLYKKPIRSSFTLSTLSEETDEDLDAIRIEAENLMRESEFSVTAINTYVETLLNEKETIHASQCPMSDIIDYIRLILIYVYSTDDKACYSIKLLEKEVQMNTRIFQDFIIRKGPKDESL